MAYWVRSLILMLAAVCFIPPSIPPPEMRYGWEYDIPDELDRSERE
jgi:hypothetical protein